MISGVSASVRRDFGVLSSPSTRRVRAADEPSRFLVRFMLCVTATAPARRTGANRNVGGSVTRHRAEARADPLAER
jgi:hypothetical protein